MASDPQGASLSIPCEDRLIPRFESPNFFTRLGVTDGTPVNQYEAAFAQSIRAVFADPSPGPSIREQWLLNIQEAWTTLKTAETRDAHRARLEPRAAKAVGAANAWESAPAKAEPEYAGYLAELERMASDDSASAREAEAELILLLPPEEQVLALEAGLLRVVAYARVNEAIASAYPPNLIALAGTRSPQVGALMAQALSDRQSPGKALAQSSDWRAMEYVDLLLANPGIRNASVIRAALARASSRTEFMRVLESLPAQSGNLEKILIDRLVDLRASLPEVERALWLIRHRIGGSAGLNPEKMQKLLGPSQSFAELLRLEGELGAAFPTAAVIETIDRDASLSGKDFPAIVRRVRLSAWEPARAIRILSRSATHDEFAPALAWVIQNSQGARSAPAPLILKSVLPAYLATSPPATDLNRLLASIHSDDLYRELIEEIWKSTPTYGEKSALDLGRLSYFERRKLQKS